MTDPHAHHTDHPTGKAATATGGDTRHGDHTPEPPTQHDTHTGHGTQASAPGVISARSSASRTPIRGTMLGPKPK